MNLHTAIVLCIFLFFVLSSKRPPNRVMQFVLMIGAFAMSIAWLNVLANEIVSILQALGILFGISTGERESKQKKKNMPLIDCYLLTVMGFSRD